ncbi:hypothetical protein [Pseudotabrizicola sp. 4114]|uniref:hypothetical protein n=1 Tax=Pseudotabrizicola sp. 4114 TaxID=2817731 RepID=UPI00285BCB28|nr:hypothetical protein [Pseudorhodobacter sp. 4114]
MAPECEAAKLRKSQETLSYHPPPSAASWSRKVNPLRRQARLLPAICVGVAVSSASFAQPEVIRCPSPEVPVTELPAAVLTEYRAEIAAEFEAYFADLSEHIACLDAERSRALSEAHSATKAYSAFLNIPPAERDLP